MTVVSSYVFAFSSYLAADYGSFAIRINFSIIPSIGSTKSVLMSLENSCNSIIRTRQTNSVLDSEKMAIVALNAL
jgi:hypothetical protein